MSLKSKNGKKYYYIIQGANISKKHRDLENHMIDHFFYKNLNWDEHRVALQEQINSFYTKYGKSFCKKNGEDEIYYDLTSSINNTENTIIYSIEKKRLDCFLLFVISICRLFTLYLIISISKKCLRITLNLLN